MSLNTNMHLHHTTKVSAEDQALVDKYLAEKGSVTLGQPFNAPGNESCRATAQLVAQRRREFRKAHK